MNQDFFSTLQKSQKKDESSSQDNQAEAWKAYNAGTVYMAMAEASEFKNGEAIAIALEHFYKAMKLDPQNPQMPLGVAYVLNLMDEEQDAIYYIRQSLQIDPDFKLAQDFLQIIIDSRKENPQEDSLLAIKQFDDLQKSDELDWDQFYDDVEDFIIAQVRMIMEQQSKFKPVHKKQVIAKRYQRWQYYVKLAQGIERQLKFLDEEFDTHELQQRFHPFKVGVKRLKQVLDISQSMQDTFEKMTRGREKTNELSELVKQSTTIPPEVHQEMEKIYDICDAVADILDDYASKKIEVEELENEYEKLVNAVQKLQEKLDD